MMTAARRRCAWRVRRASTPRTAPRVVRNARPGRRTWIATRTANASAARLAITWLRSPQAHARHARRGRRMTTTTLARRVCSVSAGATLRRARRVARLVLPANTTTTRAMRTAHLRSARAARQVSTLQRGRHLARTVRLANTTTTRATRTAHPLLVRAAPRVSILRRARRYVPRALLDGRMRITMLRLSVLLARRASTLPRARRAAATALRVGTMTMRRLGAHPCR